MRGYAEYTTQSTPGLERLPKHWSVTPMKQVVTCNDEVLGEDTAVDHEIDYVEISGVTFGQGVTDVATLKFGDAPSRARRIVRSGDVLVSTVRTYLKALALVEEAAPNLIASTGFAVLRPRRIEPSFLGHVVSSDFFVGEVISRSVGVSYPAINSSDLVRILIPLPPLAEQQAIAEFLDRETAKLDALVEEQRRLIALLKEKRQAVISHAVTRGLDPTAPLKPSGINWLGDIPAHWEVVPLKYLTAFKSGGTPSKTNLAYWDGDVPWVSARDLKTATITDSTFRITQQAVADGAAALVPVGSILVLVRGMTLAHSFPVCIAGVPTAINQDLKALSPNPGMDGGFLAWSLRGLAEQSLSRIDEAGHGTKALRMDAWASMEIPLPPEPEQRLIAKALEDKTAKLDALTAEATRAIALLQERRAAMISAAVTGKIDVRETKPAEEAA